MHTLFKFASGLTRPAKLLLGLATLIGLSNCTTGSVSVESIAITPFNPAIAKGSSQQLTATGTMSDGTTQDLTAVVLWASSRPEIAMLSATGVLQGVSKGSTTITATFSIAGTSSKAGITTATVSDAVLTSVAVTPANPQIAAGSTRQFTATGTFSDNTTQDLTATSSWQSSDQTVATIANGGLATGKAGGTTMISATVMGKTGSTNLVVTEATLVSIALTPPTPMLAAGSTVQLTATGTFSDGTTQNLTAAADWSSAATSFATVANMGSKGLVTGVTAGMADISATAMGKTGTTKVTVTGVTIKSIAVTPTNPKVAKGSPASFIATATYSDDTTQPITDQVNWISSDTTVAMISNADGSHGKASTLKKGMTTISASKGGKTGTTVLEVTDASLESIAVTPANPRVPKGQPQQFVATGTYSDHSTQPITDQVTWGSLTEAVAMISNANGSRGKAATAQKGMTTITATLDGKTGSTDLEVTDAALVSIAVGADVSKAAKGTSTQFSATGTFTDMSTRDITEEVTWSSTAEPVATVSNGKEIGLVYAVAIGTTKIKATSGMISGSKDFEVTDAVLDHINIEPIDATIAAHTTLQFKATGVFSDMTTQNLTSTVAWASSNTAAATISSADGSKGFATAVAAGETTITATSGTIVGMRTLTVSNATLTAINITPSAPKVAKGIPQQFTAIGTFSDNSTQDISELATWTSMNQTVATISNADGSRGLASTVGFGTSTIGATFLGVMGSTELEVTAAQLVSLEVTPTNPSIAKGTTQQFVATGTYSDGSHLTLTDQVAWSSSDEEVAAIAGSIINGRASGLKEGTVTITAALDGKSGTSTLKVNPASLVSIAVTPDSPSVAKGIAVPFTATGTYSDNSTQNLTNSVTWGSGNGNVASIGSNGLAQTVGVGMATITATQSGKTGTATLTVTTATLNEVTVTPNSPTIANGTTLPFHATGTFSDNSSQDLTTQVTWQSTDSNIASISNDPGTQGSAKGLQVGMVTISATFVIAPGNEKVGSTTLKVSQATLASITITPINSTLPKGVSKQFTATGNFTDNTTQDLTQQVTWASSNPAVARASNALDEEGVVSALSPGSVTISAIKDSIVGTTALTVTAATLTMIKVTPENAAVAKGITQQFTAIGTYTDNSTQDLTTQVTWTSSDPHIANISNAEDSEGFATTPGTGTVTITATFGALPPPPLLDPFSEANKKVDDTVVGSTMFTVNPATLTKIDIEPVEMTIAKGTTTQFHAMGTFSDNTTQDLTSQVTWQSSDGMIAIISTTGMSRGLATGINVGDASITASLASKTGTATLHVSAATLTSIVVTPANSTIMLGFTQSFTATGVYSDNSMQNLTGQVFWSSSDEDVAIISNAAGSRGLASAVSPGQTTILASKDGKIGFTTLTIGAPPPP